MSSCLPALGSAEDWLYSEDASPEAAHADAPSLRARYAERLAALEVQCAAPRARAAAWAARRDSLESLGAVLGRLRVVAVDPTQAQALQLPTKRASQLGRAVSEAEAWLRSILPPPLLDEAAAAAPPDAAAAEAAAAQPELPAMLAARQAVRAPPLPPPPPPPRGQP